MATYFIVCVYHDKERGWGEYEEYIRLVKPIVEEYGGRYIVRSEAVETLDRRWEPERVIAIRFPDRGAWMPALALRRIRGLWKSVRRRLTAGL